MARLCALLARLPLADDLPPRALNVGCGDFLCAPALRVAFPGWALYGLDRDGAALWRARQTQGSDLRLVQTDARALPGILRAQFGVILARHPDLFRSGAGWDRILPNALESLAPGGLLLVTLYALEEVERLRTFDLPPSAPLDTDPLPPVNLAGQDHFAVLFRLTQPR